MYTNGLKDQRAPMTAWQDDRKEAETMKMTEIIRAKVREMDELNTRGEYGGRAAQLRFDLKNNDMVAKFSRGGNVMWQKANGGSTISFEEALDSWR